MRKGQVEFILLIGIILVAVVVIYYAISISPIGPGPSSPESSVTNFIREAAHDTLSKLSENGGHLEPQFSSVRFLDKSVPYWLQDGRVNVPDMKANFLKGVSDYITDNRKYLEEALGDDVSLGEPTINANFYDSKIVLTVRMITNYKDRTEKEPYIVEIPTKFGEIVEFSKAFANSERDMRYLETFTLSSMIIPEYMNDQPKVPFEIFLIECGEYYQTDWNQVKPAVENDIRVAVARTYMVDKAPKNVEEFATFPRFEIPQISGKSYSDLDVSFHLPDDFQLSYSTFNMKPNPIFLTAKPIPMTGACLSDPLAVEYDLRYPAIVRIRDPLTEDILQFAVDVFIKSNRAATWAVSLREGENDQETICSNTFCSMDLKVEDSMGNPVQGASVNFMNCPAGTTDSGGRIMAPIPCGIGPLKVSKQGYALYSEGVESVQLDGKRMALTRIPRINFHFYEVTVGEGEGQYMINPNVEHGGGTFLNIEYINRIHKNKGVWLEVVPESIYDKYTGFYRDEVVNMNIFPPGRYTIGAMLMNDDMMSSNGGAVSFVDIEETTTDIYIFIPHLAGFELIADNDQASTTIAKLTNLLVECGLGPVTTEPYVNEDFQGCIKNIGDL